jgi:hypothetical protein
MSHAMKKNACFAGVVLSVFMLGLFAIHGVHPLVTVAAAPGVSPEMERLQEFYVGTWEYTERYAKGAVNSGIYKSELGPGGNSLVNRFHSQGPLASSMGS